MNDTGPLAGLKIIEVARIGPGPFAAMVLADMGADVIRVDRIGKAAASFDIDPGRDILSRNRRSLALDLKSTAGRKVVLRLCEHAGVLIEGFRPGVMERLGLGPTECMRANPALVYGRITGWGQTGPLAKSAGHDINFIALSGCLHAMGRAHEPPVPPLNLVGDYGGGAMLLVAGVLAAVMHARTSGRGQVVDAAILDGSALFMSVFMGLQNMGLWSDERASNLLDGGAYFYDCYLTPKPLAGITRPAGASYPATQPGRMDGDFWRDRRLCGASAVDRRSARPRAQRCARSVHSPLRSRNDGTLEKATFPGVGRTALALYRERIDVAARIAIDGCDKIRPTPCGT